MKKKSEANFSKDRIQSEIIHLKCLLIQTETYKQSMQCNENKKANEAANERTYEIEQAGVTTQINESHKNKVN